MQNNNHFYALILAGGSGTRLWPLSRKDLPKQMQSFISDKSLIAETVDRLKGVIPDDHIFISTGEKFKQKIHGQLPQIPIENIITEPVARGTTAAYALAVRTIERRDPEAIVFSMASDHAIKELDLFHQTIKQAFDFIIKNPNYINLVGIKPTEPNTSLGYIKIDQPVQTEPMIYAVEKFVEKPSLKVAEYYLSTNEYFWNTAYYCFKASTLIKAFSEANDLVIKGVDKYLQSGKLADFEAVPEIPHEIEFIDANKNPLALTPATFTWSDIGNWQSLHKLLADLSDNTIVSNIPSGEHIDLDSQDCLIVSTDSRLIATANLNNIAIISTPDTLLVLDKNNPQYVKNLIQFIKEKGLEEYL